MFRFYALYVLDLYKCYFELTLYISGPNLPLKLYGHAMVTSPTGKGIIVMGGRTETGENFKGMFELSDSMQWNRLEHTLQFQILSTTDAIPIPDHLVYEKDNIQNHPILTPDFFSECFSLLKPEIQIQISNQIKSNKIYIF